MTTSDYGSRFGPVVVGGRARSGGPDWRRVTALLMSIVVFSAAGTVAAYAGLLWWELEALGGVDLGDHVVYETEVGSEFVAPEIDPIDEVTNVLVIGSDSREGLSREQLVQIGTTETGSDLTDTIILLQLRPQDDSVGLLSFPRDLLVTRCDGTRGRVNTAFYIGELQFEGGGPGCLVQTVENLTGIPIDHYIRISFAGFVRAVDALGGVTFHIDEPLRDRAAGLNIPEPGCVTFDGVKALQFVRARQLDTGGDFGRIARQQRFAREMVREATSVGTLLNPARAASVIMSISDLLETDADFDSAVARDLVASVHGLDVSAVDAHTVPAVPRTTADGAAVVEAIEDEAEAVFAAFRAGTPGEAPVPTPSEPADIGPIVIEDGTEEGVLDQAVAAAEAAGLEVESARRLDIVHDTTKVTYPSGQLRAARVVADALGADLVPAPEDQTTIHVIVGVDAEFLTASPGEVPVDDEPAPEPQPSPTHPDDLSQRPVLAAELSEVDCSSAE